MQKQNKAPGRKPKEVWNYFTFVGKKGPQALYTLHHKCPTKLKRAYVGVPENVFHSSI